MSKCETCVNYVDEFNRECLTCVGYSHYCNAVEHLQAQLKEARADAVEYADALLDTLDGNHRYDIKDMTGCSIERCIEIETLLYGSTAIIEKYKEKK